MWVKKCIKMREMLFKNWKWLFENTNQTPPNALSKRKDKRKYYNIYFYFDKSIVGDWGIWIVHILVENIRMYQLSYKTFGENIYGNTCGWKIGWKCVKCCLKTKNGCLKTQTKHPLNFSSSCTKVSMSYWVGWLRSVGHAEEKRKENHVMWHIFLARNFEQALHISSS